MSEIVQNRGLVARARSVGDRFGIWLILLLGALTRFIGLGYPKQLVFDETYYVKDAYTLSKLGYEAAWPDTANNSFTSGNPNVFYTNEASFVVHPPLGKWIISLGINLFGAQNSFGWRFSVAVLGTAAIFLIYLVSAKLLGSKRWALVAAFLLAIDGHAIVLSRTSLLDGILMFFVLLGFYFLLLDRERSFLQPLRRPWLVAMSITLGAAAAVKWSGLYVLVFFAAYVLVSDLLRWWKLSEGKGWPGQVVLRAASTFVLTLPLAVLTYLASWTGWLTTSGGYFRDYVYPKGELTPLLAWMPAPLQALWYYHTEAYNFHVNLHASHPYAASPLGWLLMLRPTSFFYEGYKNGQMGCTASEGCSSAITALGNPAIWWVATVAVILLAIRWVRTRERVAGLILLGLGAGYLPWMGYLSRTVFQFYSIVFLPFMLMALVYLLRDQVMAHAPDVTRMNKSLGRTLYYLIGTLALSAFFLPIWTGWVVPYRFWLIHMWLPSWI